jgi:pyrroline-5-carboxylate reductase
MENHTIAFIGAGNMARSLISGLIHDGVDPQRLVASDPDQARCADLAGEFGIRIATDNQAAVSTADTVVLAVKPQLLQAVASDLAPAFANENKLVLSVAAGIRSDTLAQWLGDQTPIVRTMPNTPALIQCGATALFARKGVTDDQRDTAESIMRSAGLTVWIDDEDALDTVTALSGSGPAYYFLFMEAMETAATEMGLDAATARLLTLQTALGAAKMALESREDPASLRRRVTSPGGTTERALTVMEQAGLRETVSKALEAARTRAHELDAELAQRS